MGDSADFTFCQVGSQDDDPLESPKTIPNIKDLSLKDSSDSVSIHDKSTSSQAGLEELGVSSDKLNGMTPSKLKLKEPLMQKAGEVKSSEKLSQEEKPIQKKPAVRAKVPFEKGYSPMDWLKLTRTDPDLAGLKGKSNRRLISIDEVRQHKSESSIWTVLKGRVYNISPYMKFHPGGVDMLMKAAGKDCTSLFNKYHAWVNAEFLLEKCLVGVLDDSR